MKNETRKTIPARSASLTAEAPRDTPGTGGHMVAARKTAAHKEITHKAAACPAAESVVPAPMTVKEYLSQARRLDLRIGSDMEELHCLQELRGSISASVMGDKVQRSSYPAASFTGSIERIMLLEEKIGREVNTLVALREQMHAVITAVDSAEEQMVLRCRYLRSMTWEEIGAKLNAGRSTVRRWHRSALAHAVLPEEPVRIG